MKKFSILINGKPYVWNQITIYHKEVLQLAKIKQTTEKSIQYEQDQSGTMKGNCSQTRLVYVQNDMIFEVSTIIPLWSD